MSNIIAMKIESIADHFDPIETIVARGQGIGTALTKHAIFSSARMGVNCLYLYTESARGLYEKLGWLPIANDFYEGRPVTIMSFAIARPVEVIQRMEGNR